MKNLGCHTLTTHARCSSSSKARQTTRFFPHAPTNHAHAHAPRSRITFTHLVQSPRLRSTFMIKLARHTLTAHAHYTSVSNAPHTTRIFAHTTSNHAHTSRISLTHYVVASRLCSTFIINSHVTHNARILHTLIKSTHHTHIRKHADESRSRIAFTH
jgi:hypothetical protein